MVISLTSKKGGCGKTTSAIHLSALLARHGKTLLIDMDDAKHSISWKARGGEQLPFTVTDYGGSLRLARSHEHFVIDQKGGLTGDGIIDAYNDADVLVVPAIVEMMTLESMLQTADAIKTVDPTLAKLRALFVQTTPHNKRLVEEARREIEELGVKTIRQTVRHTEDFKHAVNSGKLASNMGKYGRLGWYDYERVFDELRLAAPAGAL
ncbi:ParA family protein [Deinococcus peraridilitoris]|nr:ParA family protein [Deinococcus peraridilitoris]